jgi:processive 1,2-diacylglycerol beta-glucosyltransferase
MFNCTKNWRSCSGWHESSRKDSYQTFEENKMIELRDKKTGDLLGTISEKQLQFLIDQLEEESPRDQDYYINLATLDMFEKAGADPELLELLRKSLGTREDMDIIWIHGSG